MRWPWAWPGWLLERAALRIRLEAAERERDAAQHAEAISHGQMREAKRNLDRVSGQLDTALERYDRLAGEMVKLKKRGMEPPPRGPKAAVDVEAAARERGETQAIQEAMRQKRTAYVEEAKRRLMAEDGLSEAVATREAERLFNEAISF